MESQDISQFNDTPEGQYGQTDAALMKQALVNERTAPELLMHQGDLLDRLRSVTSSQEEIIRGLQNKGPESELVRSIYMQELNRVKYMLRSYLRCRLLKLEQFVMYILDNKEEQQKLLPQELSYAQEYFVLFGKHMRSSVLRHLPQEFDGMTKQSTASEARDMIPEPDLNSHVFCQVMQDCGTVELDEQGVETADFEKDDLYVVRFKTIRQRLRDRDVQLI